MNAHRILRNWGCNIARRPQAGGPYCTPNFEEQGLHYRCARARLTAFRLLLVNWSQLYRFIELMNWSAYLIHNFVSLNLNIFFVWIPKPIFIRFFWASIFPFQNWGSWTAREISIGIGKLKPATWKILLVLTKINFKDLHVLQDTRTGWCMYPGA